MLWLDCHDLHSTLASLEAAIGTTPAELERALREHDEAQLAEWTEDPWQLMPREVLERFGTDVETVAGRLEGAYYFHGTRALDPEAFRRRGILPLAQMLDELWEGLRELVRDEMTDEGWAAFRHDVETGSRGHALSRASAESFPPKKSGETARLGQKVEAAGIEPASADAPDKASTSVVCALVSPGGRFADDLPTG